MDLSTAVPTIGLVGMLAASAAFAAQPLPYDGFYIGEIVPTPQKAKYSDEYVFLGQDTCIVAMDDPLIRLGAEELALHIQRTAGEGSPRPRIVDPFVDTGDSATVIAIGLTHGPLLPVGLLVAPPAARPEAYVIGAHRTRDTQLIWSIGHDALGAYWGCQSLIQLVSNDEGPRLRLAQVSDFPRFSIRCVQAEGLRDWPDYERALTWMPRYKLNYLAFGQNYFFPPDWRKWSPEQEEVIRKACNMAREQMAVQVMFHLHPHRRDPETNITISDPAEIERLAEIGLFALDGGATALMLRSDDIYPLSEADKAAFADQAEAHAHLINELLKRFRAKYPDMLFLFCPPYYQGVNTGLPGGRPEREAYLRKLGELIPPEVLVIWTGPVTRSLEITQRQTDGFTRVLGRSPFLWDNTLYAHRSQFGYDGRHPHYLFDAFQTKCPKRFYEATPGIVFNGGITEIYRIARINTADYFWNPEAYDPEASLRKALALVGGPELVDDLIGFRDAYYGVFDRHYQQQGTLLAARDELTASAGQAARLYRKISRECANEHLVEGLKGELDWATGTAGGGQEALAGIRELREQVLLDLPFDADNWKTEKKGEWTVEMEEGALTAAFPLGTPSEAGAFGAATRTIAVPESPTGKLYLIFSASDDYAHAGTPRNAWPGYLFKQVLVDDELVWEDDVEGVEPLSIQALQVVDLTERLADSKQAKLTFRGFDKRGVGNMGAKIQFANAAFVAAEPKLVRQLVAIPGDEGLGSTDGLTVFCRFRTGPIGRRQALYSRGKPFQYFAFLSETGSVTAGVFIGGTEFSAGTETMLKEGQEAVFAFTYDGEKIRLYLDGRQEGEEEAPGPSDYVAGTVYLGSYFAESQFFSGSLLDTRIYSRALTPEEIPQASAEPAGGDRPAIPEGLEGWWREPGQGDVALEDLSGNERSGTIYREWAAP